MKRLFASFFLPLFFATSAMADAPPTQSELEGKVDYVVELFTSQGCPACPAANRKTAKLATKDHHLVLTYSVPYWDYKGWSDTLASETCQDRQVAYNKVNDGNQIYTPQFVLNGKVKGRNMGEVSGTDLNMYAPRLLLTRSGDGLSLHMSAPTDLEQTEHNYKTVLIEYVPGPQTVNIGGGANNNTAMTVTNNVSAAKWLKDVTGPRAENYKITYKPSADKAYAVLVHDAKTMKILAATRLDP